MPVDRIDIHVDVPPVRYAELASTVTTENSATIRARVNAARALQRARFTGTATPRSSHCSPWGGDTALQRSVKGTRDTAPSPGTQSMPSYSSMRVLCTLAVVVSRPGWLPSGQRQ